MTVAYICSPYAGDVKENKQYARELCRAVLALKCAPIAPHLYITEALNDNIPAERETGLTVAIDILKVCGVVFVGVDKGISAGMRREIAMARLIGLKIYFLSSETIWQDGMTFKVYRPMLISDR